MSTRRFAIVRPHPRWLLPVLVLAALILVLSEGSGTATTTADHERADERVAVALDDPPGPAE